MITAARRRTLVALLATAGAVVGVGMAAAPASAQTVTACSQAYENPELINAAFASTSKPMIFQGCTPLAPNGAPFVFTVQVSTYFGPNNVGGPTIGGGWEASGLDPKPAGSNPFKFTPLGGSWTCTGIRQAAGQPIHGRGCVYHAG